MRTPRSRPDGTRPDYAQLNCPVLPTRDSVGQFQLDSSLVCISMHLQLGEGAPQPPQFAIAIEHHQRWARIQLYHGSTPSLAVVSSFEGSMTAATHSSNIYRSYNDKHEPRTTLFTHC